MNIKISLYRKLLLKNKLAVPKNLLLKMYQEGKRHE